MYAGRNQLGEPTKVRVGKRVNAITIRAAMCLSDRPALNLVQNKHYALCGEPLKGDENA